MCLMSSCDGSTWMQQFLYDAHLVPRNTQYPTSSHELSGRFWRMAGGSRRFFSLWTIVVVQLFITCHYMMQQTFPFLTYREAICMWKNAVADLVTATRIALNALPLGLFPGILNDEKWLAKLPTIRLQVLIVFNKNLYLGRSLTYTSKSDFWIVESILDTFCH